MKDFDFENKVTQKKKKKRNLIYNMDGHWFSTLTSNVQFKFKTGLILRLFLRKYMGYFEMYGSLKIKRFSQ